jgi:hypothetical protein
MVGKVIGKVIGKAIGIVLNDLLFGDIKRNNK